MSLHSYTFNDSKANVKTLLLWWTHFLVVPFFIFIHSLPIFHITAIKLHPGQINLLMLAADLFTRLRSPGFCLLRDCTGGGGEVLGLTCRAMVRWWTVATTCRPPLWRRIPAQSSQVSSWWSCCNGGLCSQIFCKQQKPPTFTYLDLNFSLKYFALNYNVIFKSGFFLFAKVLLRDTYLSSIFTSLQHVWFLINGFGCRKSKVIQSLLFVKP